MNEWSWKAVIILIWLDHFNELGAHSYLLAGYDIKNEKK